MSQSIRTISLATLLSISSPLGTAATERLCDTQYEDCREPIISLIQNEPLGIDVAFWFMEDYRYAHELIRRHNEGVPVRVLVDECANDTHPRNVELLAFLRTSGIPMREKFIDGDILHFKMMLFHGQNVVEFSKANYTPFAYVPVVPNVDYQDEAVFFTDDDDLTNSFRRRFDDLWVNTSQFRDYANVSGAPVRQYTWLGPESIHRSMNFPPLEDFALRSVNRYNAETARIDVMSFRITDDRQSDGLLAALARGVAVRLLVDPSDYRDPARLWHSKHVDRLWSGGAQVKSRVHQGIMHQASVVLHGLGEVIFGSSNLTVASANRQDEHNYFYDPSLGKTQLSVEQPISFFQWFADQFERKWNDTAGYESFQPLPPGTPTYVSPSDGASSLSTSVTLTWDGGTWAHLYDIHLGTIPTPPAIATNVQVGSPVAGVRETYTVGNLLPDTTYYWRIVSKTWAYKTASGPTWSFRTAAAAPPEPPPGGSTPFGGTAWAIPGTVQAENFDEGGASVAYYDTTAGNYAMVYRATDVDLEGTTDNGGGCNVARTRAGEWLKYTVNVVTSGTYTLETRVAMVGTGAKFHLEVDGVNQTGTITVPDTGGWQVWQTVTASGLALTAGSRVVRLVFDTGGPTGGAGNYNWLRLTGASAPPPPPPTTPYRGTPVALPGVVQVENFDEGAPGIAYFDVTSNNSGGVYRSTSVDLGSTGDPLSGGYYVGWTRVGEWLKYTVDVTQTRSYRLNVRVANAYTGATFRVEADGRDLTGPIAVPNTGGWDDWQTVTIAGVSLSQGLRVIRLVMVAPNIGNAGVANYGYFSFE